MELCLSVYEIIAVNWGQIPICANMEVFPRSRYLGPTLFANSFQSFFKGYFSRYLILGISLKKYKKMNKKWPCMPCVKHYLLILLKKKYFFFLQKYRLKRSPLSVILQFNIKIANICLQLMENPSCSLARRSLFWSMCRV